VNGADFGPPFFCCRAYNDDMRNPDSRHSLLTRRSWAALVAAVPLAAQVTSTPPTTVPSASSPLDDVRETSQQLAQIEIPMSLEPAFLFRA